MFDDAGRLGDWTKSGELVCTRPFPSMPVMFWNDPDGARYREAYFDQLPQCLAAGRFRLDLLRQTGGMTIYGRSDATLNPGGVQHRHGRDLPPGGAVGRGGWKGWSSARNGTGDTRIVLFVRLSDGAMLGDGLLDRIRRRIREHASPRHVPAVIAQVADIPRTRSGKIVELAVRDAVHGRAVANVEALENPEALELFRGLAELRA